MGLGTKERQGTATSKQRRLNKPQKVLSLSQSKVQTSCKMIVTLLGYLYTTSVQCYLRTRQHCRVLRAQ